ncbi:MAG: LamG-like jellyroll fold domain-containing protein [Planctomycetota bacterium]|jgi:type II secretory pathway pseudopilin PulG
MVYQSAQNRGCGGLTLIEMVIAITIMVIVFAALLPQIKAMRNSWDSKEGNAEALQNGRVLTDHVYQTLAKAVNITDASDKDQTLGYIVFEDNDGNNMRYDVNGTTNYVEFGQVGDLSDLAGPISKFQLTCYDTCDLDNPIDPITNTDFIRYVKMEAIFTNSASNSQDKTFITSVYLRTNNPFDPNLLVWLKLNENSGTNASDSSIYANDGSLTNMNGNEWTSAKINGGLELDGDNDYIDSSLTSDSITDSFTVSVWFNSNDAGSIGNNLVEQRFISQHRHSNFARFAFGINNNTIAVLWNDGSNNLGEGTTILDPGIWYHAAATYDGSTITLYLNGIEEGRWSASGLANPTDDTIKIGRGASSNRYFDGFIDDFCIYDRPLTASEIYNLSGLQYREFNEAKAIADTTSLTIPTPNDVNEGDLLIASVATDGDTSASLATPVGEGWTEIDLDNYNSEVTLGAWWKNADASESGSHQFTWTGDEQAYGWMMRFTGHDPSDPVDIFSTNGESSSSPTSPAVTTTVNNALILRLGGFDDDVITIDSPGLSGHVPITMDESVDSSSGVTFEEFTEAKEPGNGTSLTISTPSGTSEDDFLLCAIVTDGDTSSSLAPPAGEGWTEIDLETDSNEVTLGVWWKLAGASESGSHQFTWTGNEEVYGWMMRFISHDSTTPVNDTAAAGGLATTCTSPAVTTTAANCLIVRIGGFDDDDITVDATGLDDGHTDITMDKSSNGINNCSGGGGYKLQTSTGSSGTATFDLNGSEEYRCVTIAIAPLVITGTVSGGAGYIDQSSIGGSGTSNFSLTASEESQMVTIGIKPDPDWYNDYKEMRP